MTGYAYSDPTLAVRRGAAGFIVEACPVCGAFADGQAYGTAAVNLAHHIREDHGFKNKPMDIPRTFEQRAHDLIRETRERMAVSL